MLNKPLLALAAFCCSAFFSEAAIERAYTFKEATPTPVTQLTNGGKYFIYDTFSGREALRRANGTSVGGTHVTTLSSTACYSAAYIWIAEADGDNWKFKNLVTNTYIPAATENIGSVTLNGTAGLFTLTDAGAGNSSFYVSNVGTPTLRWDGNGSDGYGNCNMAQWHNSGHKYQFYDVTEAHAVVIDYKKGEKLITSVQYNVSPHGTYSTPALSAEVGTLSETLTDAKITADRTITATIADNVNPFKLVSARYRNTWATSTAAGLTHTADNANFAAGEWFFDVPDGYFFKIYSLNQHKYLGRIGAGVEQVAFSDTPGTFTMQKSATGAEAICNSDNTNQNATVYFNYRSNAIGAWSAGTDAGSHWFMVYDESTYNTNKVSFTETLSGYGQFTNNGIWATTIAAANTAYDMATASGMTDNTITALKSLIDQAANKRFGVAGNNIPEYLEQLSAAKTAAQTFLDSHVKVTFNFPNINGHAVASQTIYTNHGSSVGDLVAALTLPVTFTLNADVASQTVSENTTLDLTNSGHWGFPAIEFGRVYRIALRNKADNDCNYFYANASNNQVATRNGTSADAITPERLFYFKEAEGSTPNALKVTLHTLAKADNYGCTVASGNNSIVTMSTTPTVFTVVSNTNQSTRDAFGFSLQHPDADNNGNHNAHLNDIGGSLGVWNSAYSRNDGGSAFKLYSLTNEEIDAIQGVSDEAKAAAKANPNAANVLALCPPGVKAELASIYEERVGVPYTLGGSVSLPGYVSATNAAAQTVYNDCVATEGVDMLTMVEHAGALTAVSSYSYVATDGVLFTLPSTELDARGYLCNNNGQVTNTKAANREFDNNSDDFKFCFVTVDGKQYLYNLGADKFMNAFGEKTDNGATAIQDAADYSWRFNEVPTQFRGMILFTSAIAHSFTFQAGRTPSSNASWGGGVHEGGLSMTNNGERPVIVSMGITGRGDGNGLIAHYAGQLSEGQLTALQTRISAALTATETARTAIPEISEDSHIINHYTPAAKATIDAAASESADYQAYLMETGERQGFVEGKAYTIVNADNQAWGINNEGQCIQAVIGTDNADYFKWIPAVVTAPETPAEVATLAVEDGTRYTFSHTHDNAEVLLNINGATEHEIGTSTLGKVTIAGTDYVMTSNGNNATTTAITEISADSLSDAAAIYDLQGRRLAAPVKGINIINGRKVLVK